MLPLVVREARGWWCVLLLLLLLLGSVVRGPNLAAAAEGMLVGILVLLIILKRLVVVLKGTNVRRIAVVLVHQHVLVVGWLTGDSIFVPEPVTNQQIILIPKGAITQRPKNPRHTHQVIVRLLYYELSIRHASNTNHRHIHLHFHHHARSARTTASQCLSTVCRNVIKDVHDVQGEVDNKS